MSAIQTLLWDVGGVLLTNGWDLDARRELAARYQLDFAAYEARHEGAADAFERGEMSEDDYWRATVMAASPNPRPELVALRDYMRAQSQPKSESLDLLRELAGRRRWQMGTLNNESLELNQYRIERFGLAESLGFFLSSCYLDARKPGGRIFDRALRILQRRPEQCVFIDDRPENLAYPRSQRWNTIRFAGAAELREELRRLGVDPARAA